MTTAAARGFEALRALGRVEEKATAAPRCELCAAEVADAHEHLVDVTARRLACACDGCILVLDRAGAGRFRRPIRTVSRLDRFRISDADWNALGIPVALCFFLRSGLSGAIEGRYPSPAGAVEAAISESHWRELVRDEPALSALASDVQALLVDRTREPHRYLIVPIDECWRLVGILRRSWRGFSGGELLRDEVERFFAALEARAEGVT